MLIVPVLDLQGGIAVHGRAGARADYRPVVSVLTESSEPLDLGRSYAAKLGLNQVYIADLDAIGGAEPAWNVHRSLLDAGLRIWLDAGTGEPQQVDRIADRLGDGLDLVLGLETLANRLSIERALSRFGSERTIVSLDLDDGRPRTLDPDWRLANAAQVAEELLALGVTRLVLLDIRRVGTGQGTGTLELLSALRATGSGAQLICGGGVRDATDVHRLAAAGCDALLLATALHEGRIGRQQIVRWMGGVE